MADPELTTTPSMITSLLRRGAFVAFTAGALLVPAASPVALASGGTPDRPVANPNPCATLSGPAGISPESTKADLALDYKVSSCAAGAETVVISVSGVQTSGNVPTPCDTAITTLPALTLRQSDSRGFKVDAPGQADCRLGTGSYTYTAVVRDAYTGAVLATTTTTVTRMGGV